jgi:hypothetical protein
VGRQRAGRAGHKGRHAVGRKPATVSPRQLRQIRRSSLQLTGNRTIPPSADTVARSTVAVEGVSTGERLREHLRCLLAGHVGAVTSRGSLSKHLPGRANDTRSRPPRQPPRPCAASTCHGLPPPAVRTRKIEAARRQAGTRTVRGCGRHVPRSTARNISRNARLPRRDGRPETETRSYGALSATSSASSIRRYRSSWDWKFFV